MKKSRLVSLLLVLALLFSVPFEAQAALPSSGYAAYFPLPVSGAPYLVTVLDRYTYGQHDSYLNDYVLKRGAAPRGCVMDIAAAEGTPVYAVLPGEIITSTIANLSGEYIVIRHSDGRYTYYGHMSKRVAKKGDRVEAGQIIGYVGHTGQGATGNHLHYEFVGHQLDSLYSLYAQLGLVKLHPDSGASHNPPSHVCSFDSRGICSCGKFYPAFVMPMLKPAKITAVNSVSASAPIHAEPYGDSEITSRLYLEDKVTITGRCYNRYGNEWFLVLANRTIGYVNCDYLSFN